MSVLMIFALACLAWLGLLLLALGERLLQGLSLRRLQQLQQRRPAWSLRCLSQLMRQLPQVMASLLWGRYLLLSVSICLLAWSGYRQFGAEGLILGLLCWPLLLMLGAELLPRHLPVRKLERLGLWLAPLLWLWHGLSQPLSWLIYCGLQRHIPGFKPEPVLSLLGNLPGKHRQLMSRLLELEQIRVNDIMTPRADIEGLDLELDWPLLLQRLANCRHPVLVLFRGQLDQLEGVVKVQDLLPYLIQNRLTPARLQALSQEAYFVPAHTPLDILLDKFRRQRQNLGLVIDEYGDIQGLVTLADLLREIAGDGSHVSHELQAQPDGSYLLDAACPLRELNRQLNLNLPLDSAKTLNGLLLEHLEQWPEVGVCMRLHGAVFEILGMQGKRIRQIRLSPEPGGQEITRTDWPKLAD